MTEYITYWGPTNCLGHKIAENTVYQKGYMKNGKKDGKWETFHSSGNRIIEGSYVDGLEDGMWTWWNVNCTLSMEIEYKMGKREWCKVYEENNMSFQELVKYL